MTNTDFLYVDSLGDQLTVVDSPDQVIVVGDLGGTGVTLNLTIVGADTWTNIDALPSPATGDVWILTADDAAAPAFGGGTGGVTGDGLVWDGAAWVNVGPVQGPEGPTGATGAAGADGADGSVWYSGSGAPDNGIGVEGDFYLDTSTGDVYQRDVPGLDWTLVDNLTGPTGATGATGAAGADGEGVPAGGTTGQVLAKATGTDYDTEWVDEALSGDVGATDNAIVRADGTSGNTVQGSTVTVDDGGVLTAAQLSALVVNATSSVNTDAVDELSSGSGVTIDGVLIKDGEVDGVDVAAVEATAQEVTKAAGQNDLTIWRGTAAAYAGLGVYDPDTLYFTTA